MKSNVEYERLVPVDVMEGEDDAETAQLQQSLEDARSYVASQSWCRAIKRELFGLGVGGVVSVFLFEIDGTPEVDDCLWIVCGDVPLAYLVTDHARTPAAALDVYCGLMDAWIEAIRTKRGLAEAFPVAAAPTKENAAQLEKRISFLRCDVIPVFQ